MYLGLQDDGGRFADRCPHVVAVYDHQGAVSLTTGLRLTTASTAVDLSARHREEQSKVETEIDC